MPTNNSGNQDQGHLENQDQDKKPGYSASEQRDPQKTREAQSAIPERGRPVENDPNYNRDRDREHRQELGRRERSAGDARQNAGFERNPDDASAQGRGQGANENMDASRAGERSNKENEDNSATENPKRSMDRDF